MGSLGQYPGVVVPLELSQRVVDMHVPVFPVVSTVQVSPPELSEGMEVVQHFQHWLIHFSRLAG